MKNNKFRVNIIYPIVFLFENALGIVFPRTKRISVLVDYLNSRQNKFRFGEPIIEMAHNEISQLTNRIMLHSDNIPKKYFEKIESVFKKVIKSRMCRLDYRNLSRTSLPFSRTLLIFAVENCNGGNEATNAFVFFVEACSYCIPHGMDISYFLSSNGGTAHYTSYEDKFIVAFESQLKNIKIADIDELKDGIIRAIESKIFPVTKKAIQMALFLGIGEEVLPYVKNLFHSEIQRLTVISKNVDLHSGEIVLAIYSVQNLAIAIYLISKDERYNIHLPATDDKILAMNCLLDVVSCLLDEI